MDRNSIIGFLLIAAILGGYTWYSMPSAEEQARMIQVQDSLANAEIVKAHEADLALKAKTADSSAAAVSPAGDQATIAQTYIVDGDTLNADSVRQVAPRIR